MKRRKRLSLLKKPKTPYFSSNKFFIVTVFLQLWTRRLRDVLDRINPLTTTSQAIWEIIQMTKVQNEAPTFKDILELHKDSAKQERRLIKSLIKPSMGINQDVLREEIKKISARFDKMEGDINHKFDMILQRLEKGRRK
ncbi:hypothetical protein TMatcc_006923 [Talaromyces marneffei ATCC 18224]